MNRDDIERMAFEAADGVLSYDAEGRWILSEREVIRLAALVAAAEREACAKLCEEKQTYSMPIPCPDGISGCCVAHVVPARREKTGAECAAAIRARGDQ